MKIIIKKHTVNIFQNRKTLEKLESEIRQRQ